MSPKLTQSERARAFWGLHEAPIFVLANVWDVASARIFEMAGFKALGTTSAGIAATLGFPDGENIGVEATADVVRRLVNHTNLPVSADIEAGYSQTKAGVIESARAVVLAGAVGINIEDSTGDPYRPIQDVPQQQERIRAIKDVQIAKGIPLFVNARTDVFMLGGETLNSRIRSTIDRANAYREAGADCIFVPDFEDMDEDTMRILVAEIDAPLNIIAGSNTLPLDKLKDIGVTRVSLGPRHMRATFALLKRIAAEIVEKGTFSLMTADSISYSEVNEMFQQKM